MNDSTLDYLMRRMESRDSRDSRDSKTNRDYTSYHSHDERGRARGDVDFEGSMDFGSSKDSRRYRDYRDMRDSRSDALRLSKSDIKHWNSMMENFDGSHGGHYDMSQIDEVVDKLRVSFKEFSEKEFCIAVNMMYSDYGNVLKRYVKSSEELLMACAEMAKAFLEDSDGPEPSEKLALYFHCIVDAE